MISGPPEPRIKVSHLTLAPYYLLCIAATTIGILMVIVLNFFTPLDAIQNRVFGHPSGVSFEVAARFFLPKLMVVLSISYAAILTGCYQMLKPISQCLILLRKDQDPGRDRMDAAKKRLLNLHFLFVPVNVFMWVLIPAMIGLVTALSGILDHRTVIILSARASMVGLIASAIASHRIEAISRKQLIPFFFPEGRLSQQTGTSKISISKRIILANRLGAVIPVTILLVTLLTLQWEIETTLTSAATYGRGVIVFTFVLFIWTIVFSKQLNQLLSRNIIDPINDLVRVLQHVQAGRFDQKVQVVSNDEIGYAGDVVNEMAQGLQQRDTMQQSLNLAREIQQNLLPKENPDISGLEIAGKSIYCDETGGDYYDFLLPENDKKDRIRIVLADVSGHGVSSALLMATSRALFRQRSAIPGDLAAVTTDVNRQLCQDVKDSGNFITLLCIEMDMGDRSLKWVRAGHDPGVLYHPCEDRFIELKGNGIALGVDAGFAYTVYERSPLTQGQIAVLYTDGIWEAENSFGQRFGKAALFRIIQENARLSADQILKAVLDALNRFRNSKKYQDDVTLIIVKVK